MTFDAKSFLSRTTEKSGVYRMFDVNAAILYVGKAKNLKKRLASYFRHTGLNSKTQALVLRIDHIEVTTTHTEIEALLLENNLIKSLQPPYNILLRDDKGYPYLYLSDDTFPRLSFHRGTKQKKGEYFGPYPSSKAVHNTLSLMQKLFPIRQCRNAVYRNRTRPCLQYQIKRCRAPCVGLINAAEYQQDVEHAVMFLQGRSEAVVDDLIHKMQQAAHTLAYEKAALYRDQIAQLRSLQSHQYMETDSQKDVDVLACALRDSVACVQVLSIRGGRHLGGKAHFPKHSQGKTEAEILAAFLSQYYLGKTGNIPHEIILSHDLDDKDLYRDALQSTHGRVVKIQHMVRGHRAQWLKMAIDNTQVSLEQHKPTQYREQLAQLSLSLGLDSLPEYMECFDISHSLGEATIASCVVFNAEGAVNSEYRRFNIHNIKAGDDYAAMKQALTRRYSRLLKENSRLPDILLIDGGKGQVKQAEAVMQELGIEQIQLLGVAKGENRKEGLESLILSELKQAIFLPKDSPALHLIQHIRNEAHRFAIAGHRAKRAKTRKTSVLEEIEGIGSKRRKQLITHFGGLQGVQAAGVEDLLQVAGIHRHLAQKIYAALHSA